MLLLHPMQKMIIFTVSFPLTSRRKAAENNIMKPNDLLTFLLLLSISAGAKEQTVWRENSFQDFVTGKLGDGGANTYVSARGSIQIVNRWDLDNDGSLDLVFANTHFHREKLDSAIYWGNGSDFDGRRMTAVPNDGAQHAAAADLNGDGRIDAVLANYTNGTWDGMESFVYFGGDSSRDGETGQWNNPPFNAKLTLPTRAAQHCVIADLNKDGHPDLVFALSAGFWEYRATGPKGYESPSRIFWGAATGYDRSRSTDLPALGAAAVAVADLNGDNWPDLVFANREKSGDPNVPSYIYWGASKGFSPDRRTELPTRQANWVAIGDANGDKLPDIVFANGLGNASYIYLNKAGGFAPDNRLELPTNDARGCVLADLNRDGTVDLFFTNHQTAGNPLTLSYLYWGSPSGFAADRRQEFETVGAWGVSAADLNQDGFEELVISNYKEHFSFDVPSYIYWNQAGKFADTRRTSLFTQGAIGNTVADFDGDGHSDIMFQNTIGRSRGGNSPIYVYWGGPEGGYTPTNRLELPAVDPYEWASGDLNDDSWPDLLVANSGETVRNQQESFIYWGAPNGFSPENRSALMGVGANGASLADLDRDGYLDVVLSNSPKAGSGEKGAYIYWGGPDGFVVAARTELPTGSTGAAAIADLNRDGNLDLVFSAKTGNGVPIYWGDGSRNYTAGRQAIIPGSEGVASIEIADLDRDNNLDLILNRAISEGSRLTKSHIYWGSRDGQYLAENRSEFETEGSIVITVADVDKDGWLDLVCPNYNTGSSRATLSRIYYGGPGQSAPKRMIKLPTNSGAGSMVADFNRDGFNDVLFVCHRSEGDPNRSGSFGDHETTAFLYWGGPDGLSPERRATIPVRGPHNDSGIDLGNIFDRRNEYDYISSGYYCGNRTPAILSWRAQTPAGSSVQFQLRTAASEPALETASWTGPSGPGSHYTQPGSIVPGPSGSWVQYRAVLVSASGAASPAINEVAITFNP